LRIRFFGHACFSLEHDGRAIIIDPFLRENPLAPAKPEDLKVDYILVSHAHFDHLGDAIAMARASDALIISTAEVANHCQQQGVGAHAMHVGGTHRFDFGKLRLTPAMHGSGVEGGLACGFMVTMGSKTVYHAGDTGLFGDMQLLPQLDHIDVALLPIGDNFTMGIDDAARAASWLAADVVIPMHYNTWPLIAADPADFVRAAAAAGAKSEVRILEPGQEFHC